MVISVYGLFRRCVALAAATSMLVGLSATAAADDSEEDFSERPKVTFERLSVHSRGGQISIRYGIAEEDWKRARDSEVVLWASLYFPTRFNPPSYAFKYTIELGDREGKAEFPEWLSPPEDDVVGLCLMATGPGDNLGIGRGYMCDGVVSRPVVRPGRHGQRSNETIYLTYYPGYPVYPLPDPTLQGFNPPRPAGLELPE